MSDGRKLAQLMIKASQPKPSQQVDFVIGQVTSVKPLKVKVGKVELTETFLVVGALCKETTIKFLTNGNDKHQITINEHSTSSASNHTHTVLAFDTTTTLPDITLWRGLKVGDIVYMIKLSSGQKYFIMQREEGITNDS